MRKPLTFLTLAGGLAASGCASLRYEPVALEPRLPDTPQTYQAEAMARAAPLDDWLDQFNDPALEALVTEALQANPTIASRLAALEAAVASRRATYGRTLPNVSGSGGGSAQFVGAENISDPTFGLDLGVSGAWEADLWGRLAAGIEASDADLVASEADLLSTELSIAAQTALTWFDLKSAIALEELAVFTVEIRQQTLDLTMRRLRTTGGSALDVRTARSALYQAEATLAGRRLTVGNTARRLEVLLGRYPAALISAETAIPELGPMPSGGDPLLLLARRPDLAAAEARVIAAGYRADVARLALRPSLRLTGSLDLSGEDFSELFDLDRLFGRAAAGLTQPIFNGGALEADADAAFARARVQLAEYTRTVLGAWQEVEDAIQADRLLAVQEDAQIRSLDEAILAEELAERDYREGLSTIFNLIDAQNRRINAESALISARIARVQNRVRYHLALGGGVPGRETEPDRELSAAHETGLTDGSLTP
jgi:outer membrane protein, multidrug efflux system